MEAKAVSSGMTAMSRRSREHRSSKNAAGTIQESTASQLDVVSTSKNPKVGILSLCDTSELGEGVADSSNLRRSSRLTRVSPNHGSVYLSKGIEARVNGTKVYVQGVKNISGAVSSSLKPSASAGGESEALKARVNVEAVQGVSLVRQPHVVNANGTNALPRGGGTSDAAGQSEWRPLRGRPRGRHLTHAKKVPKRAKRLQEVPLTESDGARILGRRIKLFWRDENKWFYGVVKAYNKGRNSHKILYDDKEEEWVKLHEEKFKLQVLEGEVFGTHQQHVLARQSAAVTGNGSKFGSFTERKRTMTKQRHLNGENASSLSNRGIEALVVTSNICAPPNTVRETENNLESPGLCPDEDYRENGSGVVEAVGKSEDATRLVCESLDLEDPYAIDHTSIFDSLVMFMRSKQSLVHSKKVPATSGAIPFVQATAVAVHSIEVPPSVEPALCNEAEDNLEISDVALASSEACDVHCDLVSPEGCTLEERAAPEGISEREDGKGSVRYESLESTEARDVNSITESRKQNVLEGLGSSEHGWLNGRGQENVECGVQEDVDLSTADVSPSDVVVCVWSEEAGVRHDSSEDYAHNVSDDVEEFGYRAVESAVCREVGSFLGEMHRAQIASINVMALKINSVSRSSDEGSPRDLGQPQPTRLVRKERYISWYIATNLVKIECTIPWCHLSSWIPDVDSSCICVPYLTLCLDVTLESDGSEENPSFLPRICYYHIVKGIALRMSWMSGLRSRAFVNPAPTCSSPSLELPNPVRHGSHTSFDGSNPHMQLEQINDSQVVEEIFEKNPPCSISQRAISESIVVEHPCDPMINEQLCEPLTVEYPCGRIPVDEPVVLPVLEVLDSGGEKIHTEGDIEIDDVSLPLNGAADASEFYPAAPRTFCAEDGICGDPNITDEVGSAGGLTDVQIVGGVEGEDEGGLACYRSWKSVKRGFSQITPEDLGSNGLGTGDRLQGLLESELGCLALTKRQKLHVKSLSSREFEYGNEDSEKELSLQDCELHGDTNARSADTGDCDSPVPRVNVLKLRKCSTGKGGWRVAGNSCMADCAVIQSGDGAEPLTPSSTADRKRSFSECYEFNQPEENGHPGSFVENTQVDGPEICNADGTDVTKGKGMWSNCEVSSIQDVSFNPRKRFKNGSISSGSSDDSYAPHFRSEETYPSSNLTDHVYPDSVCQGCMANVLVVKHDRGWREYGATIELQSCHGQGWMLIISVHGENMYAYKAEHAIISGTTNRHNHAIVWKGRKGWSLEFDEKKQWQVFKDLHQECYRRNAKNSSARQIPIPGVRHIDDIAPRSPGCNFVRPYSRYICRMEDEVEMALGNSHVVYDMDSEDEQWLAQINSERASARGTRTRPLIAEETLERLMDKLEKDAYLYEQEYKSTDLDPNDVASDSCTGLATQEVIKVVYGYWMDKRMRKGMPLVRHFQPPAWEQYQKQLKLWEQEIADLQLQRPSASLQQLREVVRKPPLFAFCLRPRGLEARHKLFKQKAHRKQSWPGTAPRPWVGLGNLDGSLDSLSRRQYYTEPGNGLPPVPRRPGRPRLTSIVGADLTNSFNAIIREPTVPGSAMISMDFRNSSINDYAQRKAGKNKKVGRKARRQRIAAAAQRKRLLLHNIGSVGLYQHSDLAMAAVKARMRADAARARAQALYAVADAAMHKAVAAVVAADALYVAEHLEEGEEQESPVVVAGDSAVGPTFGSWRRGVPGNGLGGFASRQGLESEGEEALLPVASWSQELGAGLGTRLLSTDAEMEGIIGTRSPPLSVEMGRMRGEGMVAMPTS